MAGCYAKEWSHTIELELGFKTKSNNELYTTL